MIKRYIQYLILVLAFSLLVSSCEDESIDWEAQDAPSKLVVEGEFSNEYKKYRIVLTESADYFSNTRTPRVSDAIVRVSGGDSVYEFVEIPGNPGVYESKNKIAGKPGVTYNLDIQLAQPINGVTDYHASEKMVQGISLDSIEPMIFENPMYVEESPMDSIILIIHAYGYEPKNIENYYRVDLYINGELDTDTIDEVQVYSDQEEFTSEYGHSLAFFKSVKEGDTLGLQISSVSEYYSYFIEGIGNIANQSGNPFDMSGPPANPVSNIEGGDALGYFRVSFTSRAEKKVIDMREKE